MINENIMLNVKLNINLLASPSAGAPELNYGDANTETTSPGEVKGLIIDTNKTYLNINLFFY